MSFVNDLKQALLELPTIKRIKELENFIDSNPKLNHLLDQLKMKQKQMVQAKEFHQQKQYSIYEAEYKALYNEILNYPFVEEYLDLLEEANTLLLDVSNIIEKRINSRLKD